MNTFSCRVSGMSCAVCASKVQKTLEKQGAKNVLVNFATGDVSFDVEDKQQRMISKMLEEINKLGYKVIEADLPEPEYPFYQTLLFKFIFCAIFTIPLLLHMFWHNTFLSNPWVQFALSLPVYIVGLITFGKPAYQSILNRMPDMNVLVMLGASAAFIYSLIGLLLFPENAHHYLFFESSASIITLILLGNYIEERTVKKTSSSINDLIKLQKVIAKRIDIDKNGNEKVTEINNQELLLNDIVLVNSGDKIPMDGKIIWGESSIDESMLTGESDFILKKTNDAVVGGSLVETGPIKISITAIGKNTILSQIIELVKKAQNEKPVMQKLVDRISAIFVPTVLLIALLTFSIWFWVIGIPFAQAMMYAIAVTVIACPCAMGLATPLALMVGMGRAAKNGILIKGTQTLEECYKIKQVAFDKTGTLTTGKPIIKSFFSIDNNINEMKRIAVSLEKHSSHPIAKAILDAWDTTPFTLKEVKEIKGKGISGKNEAGTEFFMGAYHALPEPPEELNHSLYITKNKKLIGWIDLHEEIRSDAKKVIDTLKSKNITPVLISGDSKSKCEEIAKQLGIEKVFSEQMPEQKLQRLEELLKVAPTAMIGDGINDAPALAKSSVGISLSDATQIAIQQANILLLNEKLENLPLALGLGKHTFITIKENLFWAFFYNVIAIPLAAFGFLTPTIAAASMALSDIFLLINSGRLKIKKVV